MIFDLYEVRVILCTSRTILYLLQHFWRECFVNRLVSAWLSFRRGRHAADSESIFQSHDESKTREGMLWKLEWCKHQMQYKSKDYSPLFKLKNVSFSLLWIHHEFWWIRWYMIKVFLLLLGLQKCIQCDLHLEYQMLST